MPRNGWHENKKLFYETLKKVESIDTKLDKLTERLAKLEVKSGFTYTIFGTVGGGLVVLISLAVKFFM